MDIINKWTTVKKNRKEDNIKQIVEKKRWNKHEGKRTHSVDETNKWTKQEKGKKNYKKWIKEY